MDKLDMIVDFRDQLRAAAPSKLAMAVVTREAELGAKLSAQVAPCSWMYPNYPFSVTVEMVGGGEVVIRDPNLRYQTASESDLVRMLEIVKVKKCKRRSCNRHAFDPKTVSTNRHGLCETCFINDLNAKFDKLLAQEDAKLAKLDAQHKAKGFTHRVDMWVHRDEGDDEQVTLWAKNPTEAWVVAELKRRKSCVLTDYQIIQL